MCGVTHSVHQIEIFSITSDSSIDSTLMQLLQDIGKAYAALASFDCKKAISLFNALPPHQLSTCWVLQQIGTAYFEMTDYHQVPVTLSCFCQNVCCYQFICVFGVVHVKKNILNDMFKEHA